MAIPFPKAPLYPPKELVNEPVIQGIPMVEAGASRWRQLLSWLPFRRKKYVVKEDYFTWSPMLNAWIWISANFGFDGASVPRIPLALFLRSDGILFYGSLPHDFGRKFDGLFLANKTGEPYQFVHMGKAKIDLVFDDLNKKASKLRVLTKLAYWAVALIDSGPGGMKVEDQNWTQPVWRIK